MNGDWQLLLSGRVMTFVLAQSPRERRRLIDILEGIVRHPATRDDDLRRYDSRGRLHHLRIVDHHAVLL